MRAIDWLRAAAVAALAVALPISAGAQTPNSLKQSAEPAASRILPLHVPIRAVMAGIIDFSAFGVEKVANSADALTDKDWLSVGLAALNLVGASSLITLPGTGPNDAAWVSNPDWTHWAGEMQASATDVAIAVRSNNRVALSTATARLDAACQSCHEQFRGIPADRDGVHLAQR